MTPATILAGVLFAILAACVARGWWGAWRADVEGDIDPVEPVAGTTWDPRFSSHAPFPVHGYDPGSRRVYRECPDGAILPYSLEMLVSGWYPPADDGPDTAA
jgi:hypothetical protein